jgi:hypothetical protein
LLKNPLSAPSYGQPITSIPNPYGPIGSPTAYSPSFKLTGRIRYDWVMCNYGLFVQGGVAYQGHMVTATGYVASMAGRGLSEATEMPSSDARAPGTNRGSLREARSRK